MLRSITNPPPQRMVRPVSQRPISQRPISQRPVSQVCSTTTV